MKALLLDVANLEIHGEVEVLNFKLVEGMYYKTDKGMIPKAYLFDPKHRQDLLKTLHAIQEERRKLNVFEHAMFSKVLPLMLVKPA